MTNDALALALADRARPEPPAAGFRERMRAGMGRRLERQKRRAVAAAVVLLAAGMATLLVPGGPRQKAESRPAPSVTPHAPAAGEMPRDVTLREAIDQLRRGTRACAEQAARKPGGATPGIALSLSLEVTPQGEVKQASIAVDTFFGRCLTALARSVPFPRAGASYELSVRIDQFLGSPSNAETASVSHADADRLAQQSLEAYVRGQYKLSLELGGRALQADPQQPLAQRIRGAVYCKLHDRAGAIETIQKMRPQFRNFVRMICESEGVELP